MTFDDNNPISRIKSCINDDEIGEIKASKLILNNNYTNPLNLNQKRNDENRAMRSALKETNDYLNIGGYHENIFKLVR